MTYRYRYSIGIANEHWIERDVVMLHPYRGKEIHYHYGTAYHYGDEPPHYPVPALLMPDLEYLYMLELRDQLRLSLLEYTQGNG